MTDAVHITDLSAAYALGALAADDRAMVDSHIAACPECRADVTEMLGIAGTLPLACREVAPPEALKQRIMSGTREEKADVAPQARSPSDLGAARRARASTPHPTAWLAGIAAAAAIVIGTLAMHEKQQSIALEGQLAEMRHTLADAQQRNVALQAEAARGHAVMAALAQGTYAAVGPWPDRNGGMWRCAIVQPPAAGHNGMLLATVPAPPRGMAYQVWVKRKGVPHKAGMVMHGGMTMMDMSMPLERGDVVAFSVEPMTGSAAPTSPYIMQMAI